ncbi:MAG TPA: DNA/RNA non-specific endonuclease [Tepidisphaeraceae bacterium]|jgi:endonuclease G|nr:DNA/RNA non-specific endonuclease [Tepidisphaeraceae bacterium]
MARHTIERVRHVLKDREIHNEIAQMVESNQPIPLAGQWNVTPDMVRAVIAPPQKGAKRASRPFTEAVVLKYGRPSLLIRNDRIDLPDSAELRKRVQRAQPFLEPRLPSVGRVELIDHPSMLYAGTGWVIGDGVIVTNRHVAEVFAARGAKSIIFRRNFLGDSMGAKVDFCEEYDIDKSFEIAVEKVLFIEDHDDMLPDVALLKLKSSANLPHPIPLAKSPPEAGADIAVVGYPARDERGGADSIQAIHRVFGDIYEVKRLSPGRVIALPKSRWFFTHDASTLGGNSGSVVLDMSTGNAVGLHFQGEYLSANYAVNAGKLLDYLAKQKVKVVAPQVPRPKPRPGPVAGEAVLEGSAASAAGYADRKGYVANFIGASVPLPTFGSKVASDVLSFQIAGKATKILNYTHFSLAMSKSRRVCLYSAVNIDGKDSKSIKGTRPAWRIDPRIPARAQIIKECYGLEQDGKFSRGHMTRREDPNWGDNALALIANADTMHVTNACPQIQPFNAGIWNGLEDYALQNARQDDMRISVITGPFFNKDDPTMFKVRIPVRFWKIIAFIHDKTKKLTATAYTMSQESFLPGKEFIYGRYETYQGSIKAIEQETGLSFGKLRSLDPYKVVPEAVAQPLTSFSEIVF